MSTQVRECDIINTLVVFRFTRYSCISDLSDYIRWDDLYENVYKYQGGACGQFRDGRRLMQGDGDYVARQMEPDGNR